jgi:hypothetical protein
MPTQAWGMAPGVGHGTGHVGPLFLGKLDRHSMILAAANQILRRLRWPNQELWAGFTASTLTIVPMRQAPLQARLGRCRNPVGHNPFEKPRKKLKLCQPIR